jgi:hypothetical protein
MASNSGCSQFNSIRRRALEAKWRTRRKYPPTILGRALAFGGAKKRLGLKSDLKMVKYLDLEAVLRGLLRLSEALSGRET